MQKSIESLLPRLNTGDTGKPGNAVILEAKMLDLETGANVALVNETDAQFLGIHAGDRIALRYDSKETVAIANTTTIVKKGSLGITKDVRGILNARNLSKIDVELAPLPKSVVAIKDKINGKKLEYAELYEIVKDAISKDLTKEELAAFVVALHSYGLDFEEAVNMSMAMVKTGDVLDLGKKRVYDKHSIGGVPGDKTTLLVVPIIAAAGLTIPKTSSRAITSAAGTADRAEALMPVGLSISEMKRVVERANGCIVWGGAMHLAPADDIFIKAEYEFSIDPLLFPSIISKKKSVGSTDVVIDVPVGQTVKVKNNAEAEDLVRNFMKLGDRLDMRIRGAITFGEQPIGYAIGANAEAAEALRTISKPENAKDLADKAASVAGILLEMAGKENGKELAMRMLRSGRAEKKLREIIELQGGDAKIKPEELPIGELSTTINADRNGKLMFIDNFAVANAVRSGGAPTNKKAALILHKKLGDSVKKGEPLLTIYADRSTALNSMEDYLLKNNSVIVASGSSMLIEKIKEERAARKRFILER
ncbi:MAG: AMP phosphorylase [Candidatus Micrarchaeaceae archaeon]